MTSQTDSIQPIASNIPRCLHRTPAGRRCRSRVSEPGMHFCERHTYLHTNLPATSDLAPQLLGDLIEIECAEDTRRILSKLFILLAQDRIPQKKAAVLTYILQQLLRSLAAIEREALLQAQEESSGFHVNLTGVPRPIRDKSSAGLPHEVGLA